MSDDDAMQSDSPQNLRNRKKDRVSWLIEFPVLKAQVYSIENVFILRKVWKIFENDPVVEFVVTKILAILCGINPSFM